MATVVTEWKLSPIEIMRAIGQLDQTELDTLAILCNKNLTNQLFESAKRIDKGETVPREAMWDKS